MYCLKCEKNTETTNERKEEWKGIYVIKGKCKVCNTNKAKKSDIIKKRHSGKILI